jgi:hypothetical protein
MSKAATSESDLEDDVRASLERLADDHNPEIAELAQQYLDHYDELEESS